jgi:hypothetical protein
MKTHLVLLVLAAHAFSASGQVAASPSPTSTASQLASSSTPTSPQSGSTGGGSSPATDPALVIGLSVAGSIVGCICIVRLSCLCCEDRLAERFGWKKKPLKADDGLHQHHHHHHHHRSRSARSARSMQLDGVLPTSSDAPPSLAQNHIGSETAAPPLMPAGSSSGLLPNHLPPATATSPTGRPKDASSIHRVVSFR